MKTEYVMSIGLTTEHERWHYNKNQQKMHGALAVLIPSATTAIDVPFGNWHQ